MSDEKYRVNIGLEVHVQLNTRTKLFCGDTTEFGLEPNTQVSAVSLAYPGTLPVLNQKAVEFALRIGLAAGSKIAEKMSFDRKNYFYPDLPKGYQITQDRSPIARGGIIPVRMSNGREFEAIIEKIHLEEDAGKSVHDSHDTSTLIDYNRAGMPLIELVTIPCFTTGEEVAAFLSQMRKLVRYLEISDGNMEEGSLRCDVNISLRTKAQKELGKKVEIKNLNSIKYVQKAIEYERKRQTRLLDDQKDILSETRLFDINTGKTSGMRTKETLTDYRYFPDPDLPDFVLKKEWIAEVEKEMPPTPWAIQTRMVEEFELPEYDATVVSEDKQLANYFLETSDHTSNYKAISNWIMGPVKGVLNAQNIGIQAFPLSPIKLAELIEWIDSGRISQNLAGKSIFPALVINPDSDLSIIVEGIKSEQNNIQVDLSLIIDEVLNDYPEERAQLQNGKKKLMGMFMGEIMKRTRGTADPTRVRELLLDKMG